MGWILLLRRSIDIGASQPVTFPAMRLRGNGRQWDCILKIIRVQCVDKTRIEIFRFSSMEFVDFSLTATM